MTEIRRRLYARRRMEGDGLTAGGGADLSWDVIFSFLIGDVIKAVMLGASDI